MRRPFLLVSCITIALACSSESPKAAPLSNLRADRLSPAADSARRFAQVFYNWYVPLANHDANPYDSLLAGRRDFLAPVLYAAFRADIEAQRADTIAEIASVTAEYDPFLNSQDPCERYEARDAKAIAGGFAVGIYGTCSNSPPTGPAVLAEVARGPHGWRFVNFRKPSMPDYDLLSQFKKVKTERETPPQTDTAHATRDSTGPG